MKNLKLTLCLLLFSFSIVNANNIKNDEIKIKDFNFIKIIEKDASFETFYDESSKITFYAINVKNSKDRLIAYKNLSEKELTPLFFINEAKERIILKDVNNYKTTLDIKSNVDGNIVDVKYLNENDSKEGFALRCVGGSTIGCIELALTSCAQDPMCALLCGLTGWRCIATITASCALHCNL